MNYLEEDHHRNRRLAAEAGYLLMDIVVGVVASGLLALAAAGAHYVASH